MTSAGDDCEGLAGTPGPDAPDWAAIRDAYVDRGVPVRDICQAHAIHSQALYRRAEKEDWPRRREKRSDAEQRRTLKILARLRRLAEGQIDEIETRRAARTEPPSPGEPERDARALTALAKLIEHIAAIEARHQVRRDTRDGGGSQADRARRRAELADKLIAMLEQERAQLSETERWRAELVRCRGGASGGGRYAAIRSPDSGSPRRRPGRGAPGHSRAGSSGG